MVNIKDERLLMGIDIVATNVKSVKVDVLSSKNVKLYSKEFEVTPGVRIMTFCTFIFLPLIIIIK